MSYFVCGFKAETALCHRLDGILTEIVPQHLRTDPLQASDFPYLVVYGHRKVIPHLTIHDQRGSWLAVIGTPLVRLKSETERQALLADFFRSPAAVLRNAIDGNYAVFAYDAPRDRLIAATDLNNTTPIFYAATPSGVLFSSHELALARLLTPELDQFGFAQTVQLGVTWGSRTRFKNISKLLPCHILVSEEGKPSRLEPYWRPEDEGPWQEALDDQAEKWASIFSESVSKFFESSNRQPVIADLTAGEDSRLVLAQCHALGIPFTAHVKGKADDVDLIVAERAAKQAGFDLISRRRQQVNREQLAADALSICLGSDGYLEYFSACSDYATDLADPLDDYGVVKYNGFPGGEAFRGSYYLRGKALFPAMQSPLDYRFFTKMKYLLDYYPGLLQYKDVEFMDGVHEIVTESLRQVSGYPIGTKIDHLLRVFQSCLVGLKYKSPLYLPLATNPMTRSIYGLSPSLKRGGRLTRACTERLFPELAFVRTQSGVPTVRKTVRRLPMFMPEYLAIVRTIVKGAGSRLFKWTPAKGSDDGIDVFNVLLNEPPYRDWFSSSRSMLSGHLFNPDAIDSLLAQAKSGSCKYVNTFGRIVSQELALRWVHAE